jgi:hypothetical protein
VNFSLALMEVEKQVEIGCIDGAILAPIDGMRR